MRKHTQSPFSLGVPMIVLCALLEALLLTAVAPSAAHPERKASANGGGIWSPAHLVYPLTQDWLLSGTRIARFEDLWTPWDIFGTGPDKVVTLNRRKPHPVSNVWQPANLSVMVPYPEAWASGGGIWEVSTRFGPGFRVVATDEMATPWGGKAAFLADSDHLVQGIGHTEDWSWRFMLPSRGNPEGIADDWFAGVLWEFHTETMSGMHLAIDGRRSPGSGPRLRFGIYDRSSEGYRLAYDRKKLRFDRWYTARMRIKWSDGDDGFVQAWLDGRLLASSTGPTLKVGEHPYLQFGFYATQRLRNEVWFASVSKR